MRFLYDYKKEIIFVIPIYITLFYQQKLKHHYPKAYDRINFCSDLHEFLI